MIYVDFDGVIMDTEPVVFANLYKNRNKQDVSNEEVIKYLQEENWDKALDNSKDINDALYILKNSDPSKYTILTKVHSLINEGSAKIKFLRKNGIRQSVILVPYDLPKSSLVKAENNILIDDGLRNLVEWENAKGKGFFFDRYDTNKDPWGTVNTMGFQKVKRIDSLHKIINK